MFDPFKPADPAIPGVPAREAERKKPAASPQLTEPRSEAPAVSEVDPADSLTQAAATLDAKVGAYAAPTAYVKLAPKHPPKQPPAAAPRPAPKAIAPHSDPKSQMIA